MRRWGWVAAVIGFVMFLGAGWVIWQALPAPKDVSMFAAAFGDIVGTLFAALAFVGLIYTVLLQRKELSLQRQELRETREELKRTADAQVASEQAFREQINVAKLTARLNAGTALLEFHEKRLDGYKQNPQERSKGEQRTYEAVERASRHFQTSAQLILQELEKK